MQKIITYFLIFIWSLVQYLPIKFITKIGYALGIILYGIPSKRKKIVQANIALCFKQASIFEQKHIAKQCFKEVCRSILERGIVWFGSKNKVKNLVKIHGLENIPTDGAILLGIHMVGLEATGLALSLKFKPKQWASIYMPQKNKIFDAIVKKQRQRFGTLMFSKTNSSKEILRHLKVGGYVQVFADMDFGIKDSIFSKFFGNLAATITSIPRLSKLSNKPVVPMIPIFDNIKNCYDLYILPALNNYPSNNLQQDIDRLNQHFEQAILLKPSQYWWVHRRFKTKYIQL